MTYQDSVWLHYNNSLTREGVAVIIQPFGDGFAKKKQEHHSNDITVRSFLPMLHPDGISWGLMEYMYIYI